MLRIRLSIFILVGLGLFIAMACRAQSPPETAPGGIASKPIRIGASVSLEGKYFEPSAMIRQGIQLWEKQVNERGGLLGRPVELVLHDDKSDPDLVRELYAKMIVEEKVDLVLSPYGTPLTMAAAEVTTRYGYMMMACGASGEEIWDGRFKDVFGVYSPGKRYFIGLLEIMASSGLDSVAIIFENNPFSRDVAAGAKEWAERFGVKVSFHQSYNSGKNELPSLLEEVRKQNPDGLILASYPDDTYLLLDLMKAENYRPKVLAFTIASSYPDFLQKAGSIGEGVFGASQWEPDERIPFPGTKKFISDYKALTNTLPSYHSGSGYAGCQILERAVRHCQSLNQSAIANHIRSMDTVTVIGRFKVDHEGKQTAHNCIIIQWQNGKKEIVFPPNMQTAPPKL